MLSLKSDIRVVKALATVYIGGTVEVQGRQHFEALPVV